MIETAKTSLLGLAVGDAFGCMLDGQPPRKRALRLISMQRPWRWSDDTAMAIEITRALAVHGTIDPDLLAATEAASFEDERASQDARG